MKNKNLIQSFNNAVSGIVYTIKTERNMKIHIAAAAIVLVLSAFYNLTRIEFLILCVTIAIVIICELFNTAIEVVVDIIVDIYHPKAKIIKDVAAGAVFISAALSVIVGYFIFFDRISTSMEMGIIKIRQSPIHVTAIALAITVIAVLSLKAANGKGTPFRGGMPSGHAAVAFSITTAVAFWTNDARITVLCLFISFLVIQSRVEGKIHSVLESVGGAVLGFLVTLLLFQLFYK